ncbi:hypothetical protein [Streptomyces sp. NPDC097619]|uniref:hypothetical protein n=1 Tax=Streptomyces sp. NPDC097619 TaxID=3157228 RepID=UPI003330E87E
MGGTAWTRGRRALLAGAALTAVLVPGTAAGAAPAEPYATAPGARQVRGADSTAGAPRLAVGGAYADDLAPGERFYQVDLDDASSVYVSAVARPAPGAEVAYGDGIDVVLMDRAGRQCGSGDRGTFGSTQPRPLTDVAVRRLQEDGDCQEAGPYYVKLERASAPASGREPWPVELTLLREPGLATGDAPEPAPSTWPSQPPVAPSGQGEPRPGGTGFNDARALGTGVWQDALHPGETRFYRVPVDWGQQLSASAELAKAPRMTKDFGYAGSGLALRLYSPVRALLGTESATYDGKQAMAGLEKTPPVAHANRYSTDPWVRHARSAGWYYLAVTVDRKVGEFVADAEPLPLTLRVRVEGGTAPAPPYRDPAAAIAAGFGLAETDREAAAEGLTPAESTAAGARRDRMGLLAVGGIGTGSALVLGLGAWAVLARRTRLRSG